jgi:hypothetical protein
VSLLVKRALMLLALAGTGQLEAQSANRLGGSSAASPRLPPAAYKAPAPQTQWVYDAFSQHILAASDWRVTFQDGEDRPGALLGFFIPDNPTDPLKVTKGSLARLWPLTVGTATTLETSRGPLRWQWQFRVVDTERVVVPAGEFDTYVVEATQSTLVAPAGGAATTITTYWYAPSVNAVVRLLSLRAVGPQAGQRTRAQLMRIERPD